MAKSLHFTASLQFTSTCSRPTNLLLSRPFYSSEARRKNMWDGLRSAALVCPGLFLLSAVSIEGFVAPMASLRTKARTAAPTNRRQRCAAGSLSMVIPFPE